MLLLDGNDMWVNLKTSFVDIDELLLFLKGQKFSGYLQFEFSDSQCALFLQLGDVVNGLVALEEERNVGSRAVKRILVRSRQDKGGTIKVTQLPLSSKHSNLLEFLKKLQHDSFSGCIEIWFPLDDQHGIIFIENGRINAIMTEELLVDLKEGTDSQLKFTESFVNRAQRSGVQYNAFVET